MKLQRPPQRKSVAEFRGRAGKFCHAFWWLGSQTIRISLFAHHTEVANMTEKSKADAAATEQIANDVVADKIHEDVRARLSIKISDLIVPRDRRAADPDAVQLIAESFSVLGQKTPISVGVQSSRPRKYGLIAGDKRVKAAELLGWTYIDAVIEGDDEANAELWKIDENSARQDLTVQEWSDNLARRVELMQARDGQVVQKGKNGRPRGGIAAIARALRIPGASEGSKRKAVERAIKISAIVEEAKKAAKAAGLDDNQEALLDIARESGREAQLKKVAELQAQRSSRLPNTGAPAKPKLPMVAAPPLQPNLSGQPVTEPVDLLVFTPDAAQIALFGKDYGEEDRLERALPPVVKQLAAAAAVVVLAQVSDVPVIVARLLEPICGFRGCCRVFLIRRPQASEITENPVLIVAERGGVTLVSPSGWIDGDKPIDALAIAASMYPEAKNRVNVFASVQVEGWQCLLAPESWAEK
jgi:ParB/RepB/Spo0J family partition protein